MENDHAVLLNGQHIHTVGYNGRPVVYTDKPWTIRFRVQEGPCSVEEILPPRIEAAYFRNASLVPTLEAVTAPQDKDDISHLIHLEDAQHGRPLLPVYYLNPA